MRSRAAIAALLCAAVCASAALAATAPTASPRLAPAPALAKAVPAGSLIIPMDTDTASNHAAFNQNLGMWKAYGLVYKLLANGIPVEWAIKQGKTSPSDIDFTVTSVRDKRTNTALGSWDYRGGPFIIDAADAARAMPIISAFWAANGNQPNVHETLASVNADVNITLRSPPRIANEAINSGITIAYYNAASIPDSNGNPWSSTSPNILDEAKIAAGGLFEQGSGCLRRKYDIFVTPHNSGYSYSLTDPSNLGTRTYAQFDTFVQQGGGWTALCHSILSNENAIADLTRNAAAPVKSLFRTSQPGGKPGGFLTTGGFSTIDNTGGTYTVNPANAGLPTAQLVPPAVAPTLPGGSVQTWPAPGNPGAPTYWSQTERIGYFHTATVDHDHAIAGTYHDGTGEGKVTYIGGHSFATTLPYSGNAEGPYLREFYNSLFFNGSAVAKLDLTRTPGTYPQNGTGTVSVSITNTGGSTATNVGNVSVQLAPGFTYVSTTSGPTPSVSLDGRTLTWLGGLGDIGPGASAATFKVAVAPTASATTGTKQLGGLHATYGDVFGEGFTADLCQDITIAPVPGPSLTKTPASQGPVTTGSTVTWNLAYGNTGAATLLGTTLEDRLPPGFTYVSSSSTPSLGAPTVIPATSGTIVRWNLGTLSPNSPSIGTVTITARAGAVTNGTGDPPQQTFTNNATLKGKDAAGTDYAQTASADVLVQGLDITLDKTVDKAFLNPLPGSLTYTLAPRSDSSDLLDNVRVIDPLPAGVTSPPTAVGQGGTFGAYVPIAAQPGADAGPPALNTSMAVSTNYVTQGGSVTVTFNVKSATAVSNVSPSDLGIDGGSATCTGPTPASADVPAGGAGVNFTWSCTLNDLGEYTFSASASDAAATTDFPVATSASVLSSAGGGPNVVTWNLGSNTAATGGAVITSGYTAGVYGLRGATTATFQKYDLTTAGWSAKANTLANVAKGGALASDGAGTIYELAGNGTQGFNAYNIAANTWTARANTGTNVGEGGALVYLNSGATKYLYALMGNSTKTFKRYDVAANSWTQMADTPAAVKKGGSLASDGTNIFALQGGGQKGFWRYNVATNTWTVLTPIPANVNWGGALARIGNFIYATIGGAKNAFYRYDISANTWTTRAVTPGNVADGGALTTDGTYVYALQGKTTAFWRYDPTANKWTVLAPFTAATGQGGALTFDPGLNPQGRFSSLTASKSLRVTGDTVDVTLTLTSSTPQTNVVAGPLTVTPTNGASCSTLTGPVLTSADDQISGSGDPVTYQWTCTVAAGATPGSLVFSDSASATGGVTWASATSNSVLVSPLLTYTVAVPTGAPNPILNAGIMAASGETTSSPQVSTATGNPTLTIVKSNTPDQSATLAPGDPITYSMTVENTGSGIATGATVTDAVPANTDYVSCSGGNSCSQSGGTVTWALGTLLPGDTATVTFTASVQQTLAISSSQYTISNTASVKSDQTSSVTSNTVSNQVEVKPTIVKSVSATQAGPGDTLTYTLTVSNPGASFTTDVSDPVPTDTTFSASSCSPACSVSAGTVTWAGQSIPHGTSTFSFDVTVDAGTGGSTITNSGTLDPSAPNLAPIDSNPVETEIGPELAIVKTRTPTGQVQSGDTITYTLAVSNESLVLAHNVQVSDPLPPSTSFGSCTNPFGTCGLSGGNVDFSLGDVAAGATETVSFTVTVGNPPPSQLEVPNQAQVTTTDSPVVEKSNPVSNPLPLPPLLLQKSASPTTYDTVGQVISYQYKVTNNSSTSTVAGPVTVTDDKATVSCPPGDLAPLASITCTASHTITQADLNAGSLTNTATAHASGVDSNADQATVTAVQAPALTLTKKAAEGSYNAVGDVLHYTFTVQNTGNVSLAGPVTVTDDKTTDESCPAVSTVGNLDNLLDPGETITCTASYTVTQADITAGSVMNIATAHAGGTDSNEDSAIVVAAPSPHITLTKTGTLDMTPVAPATRVDAGDVIHYSLTATNDGNVPLTNVAISDPTLGQLDCGSNPPTTLAPGDTLTCTGDYQLSQADIDAGHRDNTAEVDATGPGNRAVSDTDSTVVPLPPSPHLTITKSALLNMAVVAPNDRADAGDQIDYTLTTVNDGNVTLTVVSNSDVSLPGLTCTPNQPATLAPGETLVCHGTHTLTQDEVDAGKLDNVATATGKDPNNNTVTDTDNATVPLAATPHISLVKTGTLDQTQAAPADRVDPGDVVNYSMTATNDGNVPLTGVAISDPSLSHLDCTPNQPATLQPGEAITCTGSRTLTQSDIDNGRADNTARVDATAPDSTAVSDTDSASVPLPQLPHLTLDKQAAENSYNAVGDVLHYTYTIANDGNVPLAGPVTVTDDKSTDASCPALATVGNGNGSLDPGETIVCTATYTVTQADLNSGSVTNTATAHAGGTDSNTDQVIVAANPQPGLSLVKQATPTSYAAVGDVLNYTYTVQNTGNVSLPGPVTITDDRATDASCPALSSVGNNDSSFDPGETIVCTASYTVSQADIDSGSVTNTAQAHAGGTDSEQEQVTVDAAQSPHITLMKTATLDMTKVAPNDRADAGDQIDYTFTVTNDGNVTLHNVAIFDATLTPPPLDCGANPPTTLAPGDTLVCHATYMITQDDINAGKRDNTAQVNALDTTNNLVSDTDSVSVPLGKAPHITLTKTGTLDMTPVAPATRVDAGDVIHYSLTATNDGNVPLTNVAISDPTLGQLDCGPNPPTTLQPGDTLTCTADYQLSQADIDAGHRDNTAEVDSTGPNSTSVSDTDSAVVPLPPAPHLQLTKTATLDMTRVAPNDRADVGDQIDYTLTTVNDGNVTLTVVSDSDPSVAQLDCTPNQPATLAPGETLTCTGSYTLTQSDINAGKVDNVANSSGRDTNNNTVSDTDNATVSLAAAPHISLVKTGTLDETQVAPANRVDPGDVINYSLTATNDGNVPLTNVAISDPTLGQLDCGPNPPTTLQPGDTLTCTATRTLTQADINAGHADNTGRVDATAPDNSAISDTDSAIVQLPQAPHLTLDKQAAENSYNAVGDVLHYTYTVQNDGNTTLTGPVTISDDKSTDESCPDLTTIGNNDAGFDPGETIVCTATYTVTQNDLNAGSVTNTATAHAGGTDSNTDQLTVGATQSPALSLSKQAAESSYSAVGDVLHYTYTVQNTGNVSLPGPVTITDDKSTDESCPALSSVGNNDSSFDPGETIVCTATYTVTQADVDSGSVTNTAAAHAGGTDSPQKQATVMATQTPKIDLTKTSNATSSTTAGDTVTFSFLVKNTGNVTLTSYTVSDQLPGVSGVDCSGQPSQLAPGDTATCHATYTVRQSDVDAGQIVNSASVAGQTANAGSATDSDQLTIPLTPNGTLQIVLVVNPSSDGGRFDLNIDGGAPEATNVGDGGQTGALPVSPNTDHSVSEAGTPGTDLSDYDTVLSCTRNGQPIANVDPAHISVGLGDTVVCVFTNTPKASGLAITKSAPATAHDGDTLTYGIRVTNTGSVPIRNVRVTDPLCQNAPTFTGGDANGDGRLDTTEAWTYTCTYVVQPGDEDSSHHIVNTAQVTGTDGSGHSVGPVAASAATLITHPAIALVKTGPATARPGASITYKIEITNTGDTSFDAAVVKVVDPLCGATPLQPVGKNGDASPATFDPGDRWDYNCTVKTSTSGTAIHNSASVEATDVHLTTVNATDTVDTQLIAGEQTSAKRGRARLTGRTGCVYKPFTAAVRGKHMARVVFRLDGKVVKRRKISARRQISRMRINPARLKAGSHRVTARVSFVRGSRPRAKTLRLSFRVCRAQVRAPRFTG